jgi:2-polyprenyl-3-methyl-5-hydroxy-6-metoxy-1,4-benzoquinol methylase
LSLYDKYILPKVLNCTCGSKPISYQRKKVVPLAKGVVLDIGIGSGLNIPFYDLSRIDKIYGLDPSSELIKIAKKMAVKKNISIKFLLWITINLTRIELCHAADIYFYSGVLKLKSHHSPHDSTS